MKRFFVIFTLLFCALLCCVGSSFLHAKNSFEQKGKADIVKLNNHLTKENAYMNIAQTDYALSLFNRIYDEHLSDSKCYFVLVPDKAFYLYDAENTYEKMYAYMCEKLPAFTPINVYDLLCADDYFYTDMHLKQECVTDVCDRISSEMGHSTDKAVERKLLSENFLGNYAQKSSIKTEEEKLCYLTNDEIKKLYTAENIPIYDFDKLSTENQYDFFLSGNQSVITIKNDNAKNDNRLIVFRDSFFSNVAPLLSLDYAEVVLVDLRYIISDVLSDYVDFENADVLFMYSTTLVNSSLSMK